MTRLRLALVGAALELAAGCGDSVASSSFTSGPHPITSTSSGSDTSGSSTSTSSSGSTSDKDSGSGAVSASGTTTGNMSTLDMGPIPDFGGQPIGCQGKIDFLFVISSGYEMKVHETALQAAFPAFTKILKEEFADFDYHIMVVDGGGGALLEEICDDCYMCIGCKEPGCKDFGGPEDYPCNEPKFACDVANGAGVTINGNFGASNERCDLFGGNRYIVKGEPDPEGMFECIATVGEGPKTGVPMYSLMAAIEPTMLYNGGCNEGFLRKDALLAVVVIDRVWDDFTPGTPQDWYDKLVAIKGGNEEAIVTLVLSNDLDEPNPECLGEQIYYNRLRLFAETAAHGRFESICAESYVPALQATAATIIEQCSLLIPG